MGGRFLCRHFMVLPGWQIFACLFPYIGWLFWVIKMDGMQAEGRFWVWAGYLSKYFCKERNHVQCVFWASERWMDACA
jgi:hypothetical protein